MNPAFRNIENQPVQQAELELKYLKQTIYVLRKKLENTDIIQEEKVQEIEKRDRTEISQLKDTVNSLRDNLERSRIGEEERVQQALSKINDENL